MTAEQYEAIIQYVLDISELGVVPSKEANLTSNYIFSIDLVLPNKEDVLTYLDNDNAAMPVAKAKVSQYFICCCQVFQILASAARSWELCEFENTE